VVYDPVPSKTMPFLLMISVLGAFLLTQMRKLMICDWKLPFPSGTASGIMLTSFHTAVGSGGGGEGSGGGGHRRRGETVSRVLILGPQQFGILSARVSWACLSKPFNSRKLKSCDLKLPFPSGTASGILLTRPLYSGEF
jgi:uncharacterized oligopeptide transporter (OPT) family protein